MINIEIYFDIAIGVVIIICCLVRILNKRQNIKMNIFLMIVGINLVVVCVIVLIFTDIRY